MPSEKSREDELHGRKIIEAEVIAEGAAPHTSRPPSADPQLSGAIIKVGERERGAPYSVVQFDPAAIGQGPPLSDSQMGVMLAAAVLANEDLIGALASTPFFMRDRTRVQDALIKLQEGGAAGEGAARILSQAVQLLRGPNIPQWRLALGWLIQESGINSDNSALLRSSAGLIRTVDPQLGAALEGCALPSPALPSPDAAQSLFSHVVRVASAFDQHASTSAESLLAAKLALRQIAYIQRRQDRAGPAFWRVGEALASELCRELVNPDQGAPLITLLKYSEEPARELLSQFTLNAPPGAGKSEDLRALAGRMQTAETVLAAACRIWNESSNLGPAMFDELRSGLEGLPASLQIHRVAAMRFGINSPERLDTALSHLLRLAANQNEQVRNRARALLSELHEPLLERLTADDGELFRRCDARTQGELLNGVVLRQLTRGGAAADALREKAAILTGIALEKGGFEISAESARVLLNDGCLAALSKDACQKLTSALLAEIEKGRSSDLLGEELRILAKLGFNAVSECLAAATIGRGRDIQGSRRLLAAAGALLSRLTPDAAQSSEVQERVDSDLLPAFRDAAAGRAQESERTAELIALREGFGAALNDAIAEKARATSPAVSEKVRRIQANVLYRSQIELLGTLKEQRQRLADHGNKDGLARKEAEIAAALSETSRSLTELGGNVGECLKIVRIFERDKAELATLQQQRKLFNDGLAAQFGGRNSPALQEIEDQYGKVAAAEEATCAAAVPLMFVATCNASDQSAALRWLEALVQPRPECAAMRRIIAGRWNVETGGYERELSQYLDNLAGDPRAACIVSSTLGMLREAAEQGCLELPSLGDSPLMQTVLARFGAESARGFSGSLESPSGWDLAANREAARLLSRAFVRNPGELDGLFEVALSRAAAQWAFALMTGTPDRLERNEALALIDTVLNHGTHRDEQAPALGYLAAYAVEHGSKPFGALASTQLLPIFEKARGKFAGERLELHRGASAVPVESLLESALARVKAEVLPKAAAPMTAAGSQRPLLPFTFDPQTGTAGVRIERSDRLLGGSANADAGTNVSPPE